MPVRRRSAAAISACALGSCPDASMAFVPSAQVSMSAVTSRTATTTSSPNKIKVPTVGPSKTGTEWLSPATLERAKAGNKVEKLKLDKDGTLAWQEVHEYAAAVRSGKYTWDELHIDDADQRLKYAGLFHRRKRAPGTFMVRCKIPNGLCNAEQLRFMAEAVSKYSEDQGVLDITTRQSMQLRGVQLEDASDLILGLRERGVNTLMSGLDNVRNMVGSPIAGIDPLELVDTRQICIDLDNWYTNFGQGNSEWGNLPRKFNIAVSGSQDDFAHTMINDLGLQPVADPESGEMGFNVVVGGYFSIKRNAHSIPLDMWVSAQDTVTLAEAVIRLFRDNGARKDRQKARLLWLVEEWGPEKFRDEVIDEMARIRSQATVKDAVDVPPPAGFARRDIKGVHPQKQEGLSWVCVSIPAGRLSRDDLRMAADAAEKYSGGEVRLTVEQDMLFPNVKNELLEEMQQMPFFQKFPVDQGAIISKMVSCTGAQFCGVALIETKNRAMEISKLLDQQLRFPSRAEAPRIHWTGCPNSCGQAQIGDIGIMGGVAKKDGKAVEGVNIFVGGKLGDDHQFAEMIHKGVPATEEDLLPVLKQICVDNFGAVLV